MQPTSQNVLGITDVGANISTVHYSKIFSPKEEDDSTCGASVTIDENFADLLQDKLFWPRQYPSIYARPWKFPDGKKEDNPQPLTSEQLFLRIVVCF